MLTSAFVIFSALLWLGLLFGAALLAEKKTIIAGFALALGLQPVAGSLLHLMDFLRHGHASAAFWLADSTYFYRQYSALRICISGLIEAVEFSARTQLYFSC